MSSRTFRRLAAFSGIGGQFALGAYYSGAVVPPALLRGVSTTSALVALAADHRSAIVFDAWLQCTGALLTVIFFLALVDLAGARRRFAGRLIGVVAAVMLAVAMADATFAIVAANAAALGHPETTQVAFDLVAGPAEAFDYAFLFVPAPALILSLGVVLMSATVLPRPFTWSALTIGLAFVVVGLAAIVSPLSGPAGAAFLSVQLAQVLWIMAAALTLLLRRSDPAGATDA